jgi:hypothetical protein
MASVAAIVAAANRSQPATLAPNVHDIRANFCGMRDADGIVMFDPYLLSLWLTDDAKFDAWLEQKRQAGLTHLVVCPVANYPTIMEIPSADVRTQPDLFASFVADVVDEGFVPVVMLTSGDGGTAADINEFWPGLFASLLAYIRDPARLIVCPGFELVGPGGGWTSAELSRGLLVIHAALPTAILAVHLQPERATGASHPVEPDDPWHGDEAGFWWSHGGEFVDVFLYQTPHGAKLLDGDGWEDRWLEIVTRLGVGARGWRQVPLNFFESIAYDYSHGNCSEADGLRLRLRAQELCHAHGITCTWGNG